MPLTSLEGVVGPQHWSSDGTLAKALRIIREGGSLGVDNVHARYQEAVLRGNVYMACNQAVVTFGTALTATGVTFHLCNPIGSKVNLVVLQSQLTVVSCTVAGSIVYAANVTNPTAVTVGTDLTVQNALLNGSSGIGKAKSATTLPAAPVAVRPWVSGITAAGFGTLVDYVDGALIVGPGCTLSVQGITIAGTGLIGMCWEEVALSA